MIQIVRIGLLVNCLFVSLHIVEDDTSTLSAEEILARMVDTYRACESYSDSGKVVSDRQEILFSTRFVRPGKFRFEFKENPVWARMSGSSEVTRYIIWRDGEDCQTYWDIGKPKIRKNKSFGLSIAAATGVSLASSHWIAGLLLPDEVGGRKFTDLKHVERLKDVRVGENDCFQIRGLYAGQPMVLHIDQEQFLLRMVNLTFNSNHGEDEQTTVFLPVVNTMLPPDEVAFHAPVGE